jgi:hypothetical protein
MILKVIENVLNIRLMFDKIDPAVTAIVIDKTQIILKSPRRG